MKIKAGASIERVVWQMFHASLVLEDEMTYAMGYECVITCGSNGVHMIGTLHGDGKALDYRARHIPADDCEQIVKRVKARLGPDYDVIYERQGPTHFHIEYDPK